MLSVSLQFRAPLNRQELKDTVSRHIGEMVANPDLDEKVAEVYCTVSLFLSPRIVSNVRAFYNVSKPLKLDVLVDTVATTVDGYKDPNIQGKLTFIPRSAEFRQIHRQDSPTLREAQRQELARRLRDCYRPIPLESSGCDFQIEAAKRGVYYIQVPGSKMIEGQETRSRFPE